MKLTQINNKQKLDDFVAAHGGDFLQSWAWGEFQRQAGFTVTRWGVEEDEELLAAATVIKKPLLAGFSYWFCPRGPIINFQFSIFNFQMPTSSSIHDRVGTIFNFLILELQKQATRERVIFFRFEPTFDFNDLTNSQFIRTLDVEPSKTSILDLTKSENQLLATTAQKTRYNIRLAEKRGVEITRGESKDFAAWWQLLQTTAKRDNFRLHARDYYQRMLEPPNSRLYLAKKDGQVLAGIFVVHFGGTAVYLHGASADEARNLMAPYLLQWTAITDAQAAGFKNYDFYGIDEVKWPGVSRFKLGFGGQNKAYAGTFDFAFDSLYYRIYQVLRKVRRMV